MFLLLLLLLPFSFFTAEGLSFLSFSALRDCPNTPVQQNVQIEQISGSWRLAYLFYDEEDDTEEDGSCVVTEFTPLGTTHMSIAVHVDLAGDDFIDRTTIDLVASFHSPGDWLLHSNLSHTAYLRVRVVSLTKHHMILTFCISNATDTDSYDSMDWGYNYILQKLRSEGNGKYFVKKERKLEHQGDSNSDVNELFGRGKYFRRKRSLLDLGDKTGGGLYNNEIRNAATADGKNDKHFWTVILVKDNNVSAFKFVEYASLLIKLGFDVKNGNLLSFGKCGI